MKISLTWRCERRKTSVEGEWENWKKEIGLQIIGDIEIYLVLVKEGKRTRGKKKKKERCKKKE